MEKLIKKFFFIIIFSFYANVLHAQNSSIISGTILDSLTKEPISGATVNVNYGEMNIMSDANGQFSFLPLSKENVIVVKYIGYRPWRKIISNERNFRIMLSQVNQELDEVLISSKAQNELIKRPYLGVNSLNINALVKIPTALGEVDVLRGIQLLPGVSSVGEASNGVNIRGGTTDQNLILIDDSPIFNPTHMFGLFSAFPTEAISSFDLYKGNVPSRFGGRAAAVLDVNLKNPDLEKVNISGGISLVSEKIRVDIPIIKDRLGISFSGRLAINDFLLPLVSKKLKDIKAKFGDESFKLFFKINSKNTFTYTNYYSFDFFQTAVLGTINNINSKSTQYSYTTFNNVYNWFHAVNEKLFFQTKIITSKYKPQTILPEVSIDNNVKIQSNIQYSQFKTSANYNLENQKIELGMGSILYKINPGELNPGSNQNIKSIKTQEENAIESGIYVDDEIEISKKLILSMGLRYSYFFTKGPLIIRNYENIASGSTILDSIFVNKNKIIKSYGGFEPRLGFRFQLNSNSSVKGGFNLMRQYLQVITNTTTPLPTSRWKTSDKYLKPQISSLYTIGYFHEFNEKIYEFSVETYYRFTKNIVDYKPGADFLLEQFPETQLLQGINKSYGIETMLTKKKGELTGWFNYTYARSFNKVNVGNDPQLQVNLGEWYRANYDRPHTFNATVVINQGKHHDFSFNFTYSTGRPISSPQGFIKYQENTYPFYASRNNSRLPDYNRLDFSWNIYNPNMKESKKWKGNWNFTIYNLYGMKNAYSIFFKNTGNAISAQKLVIFGAPIVSLAYNFKFN